MPISKKDREKVFNKYGGHCAYCGCEITLKSMHVDHYLSQRNFLHHILNNWRIPEHLTHLDVDDVDHIDNLMPACVSCNKYKTANHIEAFRADLQAQAQRLRNNNPMIRLNERFGIIQIIEKPIVFYFEKSRKNNKSKKAG